MAMAKSGAAIIGGVMVPAAEVIALKALVQIGRPATVPEIARTIGERMSDASLYSLLGRLDEQRRLVSRKVVFMDVHGTTIRRVMWSAHQAAISFFTNLGAEIDFPSRRAASPEAAAG